MALVMSSPILCSSKSLDGPSGELPESPFTFSQALQKVKAVFPNGSPVPTKYEAVAPCSRKRSKDRRTRGQTSDSHAAARRPNVRALRAFCRLRSARLRPLFSAKQLSSLAERCAPRVASACPQAVLLPMRRAPQLQCLHRWQWRVLPMRRAFRRAKKGASIRAPGLPPRRKRLSGVLPRIPAFCLSSPSLL